MAAAAQNILALSGGVGGAKLSLGLADVLPEGKLHILVNTGDDFRHFGLHISPDIDTHLYTLAGRANQELGWGLAGESWNVLDALKQLGGDSWFRLGDRDLATHLWRTQQLALGRGLGEITADLAQRLGVSCHIYPMSEERVSTTVHSARGDLPFQHYFVRDQCQPAVTGFSFEGISQALPNAQVMALLQQQVIAGTVICPSNPFVSIDPILQLPGMWPALRDSPAPVVVVSPIVAGLAIKGPAAKMMAELGMAVTAVGVARHYSERYPGLMDYFVIDESDATLAGEIRELGVEVAITSTIMTSRQDKQRLATFAMLLGGA
jgi:LPPG:FO 2-phospho-L-lactate transferase